jgi:signal transduction histidine kinase
VSYERFDRLDGLMGTPEQLRPLPTAVEATDGQIWFALTNGVVKIDPKLIRHNTVVPTVLVQSVVAGGRTYTGIQPLSLPVGVTNLQFNYTATSLAIPERVVFRYMLDGFDNRWMEAAQRRQAFYTNLPPGSYRFRVIASNDDGVWNAAGASIGIEIPPVFYQTRWFAALCLVVVVFLSCTFYQLRVRQVARALSVRFDERLAERTRIARDLHDTLLQTIQGSKLVIDDALEAPQDLVRMRRAVKQLSGWLQRAIQEGRAALASLRASGTRTSDLVEDLRRVTEPDCAPEGMSISFSVIGEVRDLHPLVREEVCRVGEQAVRNALAHSRGRQLEVELRYAQDLAVRVSDDGVGIDSLVLQRGKEGHFGLQGMRERASRIGGKLTVLSSPNFGTEVTIVVPGRLAFRSQGGVSNLQKISGSIL